MFTEGFGGTDGTSAGYAELVDLVEAGKLTIGQDPGEATTGFEATGITADQIDERFDVEADDVAYYEIEGACGTSPEPDGPAGRTLGVGMAHSSTGWRVIAIEC